jgi:hypothetical protein
MSGAKLLRFLAATAGFLVLMLVIWILHGRFLTVDVVFYSALADVGAAVAIAALALWGWRGFSGFNGFEKMQMLLAWSLIGYVYAISVPTVIDRSLSFYILEKLQQRGGELPYARFEDVFTHEYVREHQLVAVRLTEQQASGTITIESGCVRLTPRGRRLATFSRFFRQNLLPRHRLLMGRYTDALTDPFRNSVQSGDHGCGVPAEASSKK